MTHGEKREGAGRKQTALFKGSYSDQHRTIVLSETTRAGFEDYIENRNKKKAKFLRKNNVVELHLFDDIKPRTFDTKADFAAAMQRLYGEQIKYRTPTGQPALLDDINVGQVWLNDSWLGYFTTRQHD